MNNKITFIMYQFWSGAVSCMLMCTSIVASYNDRPIIGVVVQSSEHTDFKQYGDTYLYSSYVKYLQMAGARVVPVLTDQDEEYYEDLFSHLNGALFPGGSANLETSGYAHVGEKYYNMSVQAFDSGDYFPLWGTCNGFELLSTMTAGKPVMSSCDCENLTLPLDFSTDFRSSRMFANIPDDLAKAAASEPLTQNNHQYCLTSKTYEDNSLLKTFYRVVSTNDDRKGVKFISVIEGKHYPFYSVQFHPEKTMFNWQLKLNVSHTETAVRFAQYLANFFVEEARKSNHQFPSSSAEAAALIDNYQPHFLGSPDYHNVYGFNVNQDLSYFAETYWKIRISEEMCHHLQLIGGTIFVICGMLLFVAWIKSLYLNRNIKSCQKILTKGDANVWVDPVGPKQEKALLVM